MRRSAATEAYYIIPSYRHLLHLYYVEKRSEREKEKLEVLQNPSNKQNQLNLESTLHYTLPVYHSIVLKKRLQTFSRDMEY